MADQFTLKVPFSCVSSLDRRTHYWVLALPILCFSVGYYSTRLWIWLSILYCGALPQDLRKSLMVSEWLKFNNLKINLMASLNLLYQGKTTLFDNELQWNDNNSVFGKTNSSKSIFLVHKMLPSREPDMKWNWKRVEYQQSAARSNLSTMFFLYTFMLFSPFHYDSNTYLCELLELTTVHEL